MTPLNRSMMALLLLGTALSAQSIGIFEGQTAIGPIQGTFDYIASGPQYRITAGGNNAKARAGVDALYFAWRKVAGDFSFSAEPRIAAEDKNSQQRAALMIRQSLEPDSPYAAVVVQANGVTSLEARTVAGGAVKRIRSATRFPSRVTLVRRGETVSMITHRENETSDDSEPITVILQSPVYAGLALYSQNARGKDTAMFSKLDLRTR